jgi:hypothetical protein
MCNNISEAFDRARVGSILRKRNVSSRVIIIAHEFRKNLPKVLFVEHNQMITALAPDRPDQALNMSVLPGRVERGGPIPNAHRSDASFECATECFVIVANEIFRYRVPRKRLCDLASQPLGRRMSSDCIPDQPSSAMAEDQKHK